MLDLLPNATQNIEASPSDRIVWDEMADTSEAVSGMVSAGRDKTPTWPGLARDVFATFYKPQPTLADEDLVEPGCLANRPLVEALLEEPATEQARSFTVLDETASALAAVAAGTKMLQSIQADPGLAGALQRLSKSLDAAPPKGAPGHDQAARDAAGAFRGAAQGAQRAIQKAARQAARQGARAAEEAQTAVAAWGMDPGAMRRVPLSERLALAQALSTERFRRMGDLIGRLRNLGRARQREKVRRHADELHSITQGADLARVLPVELSALGHPLRRLDFGRRLLERGLLQYELRPRPKDAKGPVICLIDASGSMGGDRIEWAAAVGLALFDIARTQKREFAAAYFHGPGAELSTFRFPKGQRADPRDVLRFATQGADGGTSFEEPLSWALDIQAEDPALFAADIAMVTDGECALSDAFRDRLLAEKAARGLRIFSLVIGGAPDELTRWSDRVWEIGAPDDAAAGEMFAEI